jgi:hypothetical protein
MADDVTGTGGMAPSPRLSIRAIVFVYGFRLALYFRLAFKDFGAKWMFEGSKWAVICREYDRRSKLYFSFNTHTYIYIYIKHSTYIHYIHI